MLDTSGYSPSWKKNADWDSGLIFFSRLRLPIGWPLASAPSFPSDWLHRSFDYSFPRLPLVIWVYPPILKGNYFTPFPPPASPSQFCGIREKSDTQPRRGGKGGWCRKVHRWVSNNPVAASLRSTAGTAGLKRKGARQGDRRHLGGGVAQMLPFRASRNAASEGDCLIYKGFPFRGIP